jgi:hypothetical protein
MIRHKQDADVQFANLIILQHPDRELASILKAWRGLEATCKKGGNLIIPAQVQRIS